METTSSAASEPVPLATLRWGSGERRALLLHGIGGNAAGWWRVGAALAHRGWSVAAPDLRGHGNSPRAADYGFGAHADDVVALGTGWDVVLGHSMGGAIATLAASRHPDWARGLVLQDPALILPDDIDQMLDFILEEVRSEVTVPALRANAPRMHEKDAIAKAEALLAAGEEMIEKTVRDNWPWNLLEEAAGLRIPTVIVGSDPETGGVFAVALGRWLEEVNPLIHYELIAGSTHSAHRDDDAFETYLSTLVGAVERLPTLGGD